MAHKSIVRSGRVACVGAIVIALACAGAVGCGKRREEPKRTEAARTGSPSNVTIRSDTSAPDVELKALDGTTSRLSDFRGDIVIMTFLTTWNKESASQIEELNKLQAKLQRYRFAILAVFMDKNGKTAVKNFIDKNPAHFDVFYNGAEFIDQYGGVRPPTTYILLRDGSIYTKEVGFRTMRALEAFTLQINAQRL
jgi:peroxiredoxin